MISTGRKPFLTPVGLTDIPRADAEIKRTVETLRTVQFEQDPLFDLGLSFRVSLCNSAVKREGKIIEAAIKDAIEQTAGLRLVEGLDRPRQIDIKFEWNHWLVGLEIKRSAQQDSKAVRQFRSDLQTIPALLRSALPLFPAENVRFHIVFITGAPCINEGLSIDDLGHLYGLHARSHILTARQRYSAAIQSVLRERGL
jgi:hypothetical protein